MPQPYSSVVRYNHTASDDNSFRMVSTDLWLREANVHCESNSAKYGDADGQDATVDAGDILVWERFNLADFFFKNHTAGANTVIRVVSVAMSKKEILEMLR